MYLSLIVKDVARRIIILIIVTTFICSCASTQTQVVSRPSSDLAKTKNYVATIGSNLDGSIAQKSELSDFWDKMLLLPVEPYVSFDSNWMEYIHNKSIEFETALIPQCKQVVLDGFKAINIQPKETSYRMLRSEFILACWKNPDREAIRISTFQKLSELMNSFFLPIYEKAENESKSKHVEIDTILKGTSQELPLEAVHKSLREYADQEREKLQIRVELDRKYAPILQAEFSNWLATLSPEQRNKVKGLNASNQDEFVRTLTPVQYAGMEWVMFKTSYLNSERQIWQERMGKLTKLEEWLKTNPPKPKETSVQKVSLQGDKGAEILKTFLMTIATCALAYAAWSTAYYSSYRTQTVIVQPKQNIQLYDSRGNYFWGTIR